jgi:hypothetical protein
MKMAVSWMGLIVTCAACSGVFAQTVGSELKPLAFSTLDTNKDGKLSPAEARADPELAMDFEMLDLNHDGFLTPTEFAAWPRAQKARDPVVRDPATAVSGSAGAQHMPPTK